MVNINIKISNKTFYLLVGIFAVLLTTGVVFAATSWTDKSQSHDASNIKVTIEGTDYSLQEAISEGLIGGGTTQSLSCTQRVMGATCQTGEVLTGKDCSGESCTSYCCKLVSS